MAGFARAAGTSVDLAACQVFVTGEDYASAAAFERMLARIGSRLDAARARDGGAPDRPCLAVFPENIGTFLPLAGRLEQVRRFRSVDGALARLAIPLLPRMARQMARARTGSPRAGFLLAVSDEVRATYERAFAAFARRHRAWVVAGSALIGDGRRVYNTSYTFAPDGRRVGATRKVNLVPTLEDRLGLACGRPEELRAVETDLGRVGTLICYDGFAEPHTRREPGFRPLLGREDREQVAIVAQPAANPWPWDERWVFAEPGEHQLRREQWRSEGLYAQLAAAPATSVRYAVCAHLLGRIFDQRFEGRSEILERTADGVRVLAEAARWDADPASEEVVLARVARPA